MGEGLPPGSPSVPLLKRMAAFIAATCYTRRSQSGPAGIRMWFDLFRLVVAGQISYALDAAAHCLAMHDSQMIRGADNRDREKDNRNGARARTTVLDLLRAARNVHALTMT